jgi:hypothetical protein
MSSVLAVALSLAAWRTSVWWSERYAYCARKARQCAELEHFCLSCASQHEKHAKKERWKDPSEQIKPTPEDAMKRCKDFTDDSEEWFKWREKYTQAAINPFASIPPDLVTVWQHQYGDTQYRRLHCGEMPPIPIPPEE